MIGRPEPVRESWASPLHQRPEPVAVAKEIIRIRVSVVLEIDHVATDPAGAKHADHLPVGVSGILHVLEHGTGVDEVHALLRERQVPAVGDLVTHTVGDEDVVPVVIVEVDAILEVGSLDPNTIVTPGILVDILVFKGDSYYASRT